MMQTKLLIENARIEATVHDGGTVHVSAYNNDEAEADRSLIIDVMLLNSDIEQSMKTGCRMGLGSEFYNRMKEEIFELYNMRGSCMKVKHLKTAVYKPRMISKKSCKKIIARSRCFLNTYFIKYVRREIDALFAGYKISVFELARECEKDKLQLEGYKTLLRFQRVGCCYSFLLTSGGCSLCDDPDKLQDGSPNRDIAHKRCSRFDTSKNRSRDWRLFGIKLKSKKRRFIILWKTSKKYDKKIKEILNG